MKKWLALSLVFILSLSVLAGCATDAGSSESTEAGGSDAAAEAPADSPKESFVLKFGMVAGNQSNEYKAAEKLAELASSKSDGRLTIELFPNSQLGDDRAMLEQLTAGVLDLTLAETGRLGIWVPRAELAGLAYMFDDYDHLMRVLYDTSYGQGLHDAFYNDFNWKVVSTAYNGTRQTSSNRPIESIEDMEGLKLRTPQHQPLLDYAEYVGASPTPMAFTEVYLTLQTNAVDAQENPLSTIKAVKFHEVQDYIAMTNHVINDVNYIVARDTWEKLPTDLQAVLEESIEEAASYHTSLFQEEEAELIAFFEGEGLTVTKPNLAPFREAVAASYSAYFEKMGEDVANEALAIINEARE